MSDNASPEPASLFARLFANMRKPRSFPHTDEETRRLEAEQKALHDALIAEFARSHGLTCCRGWPDWWRIIGAKPHPNLPEDDHGELFARDGKPAVYVAHIYGPLSDARLGAMTDAATRYGLKFTIDPMSWYYPGATMRVIWTRRDDPLGNKRVHELSSR